MHRRLASLSLCLLLAACHGCGKGKNRLECHQAEGQVFFNKRPASGVRIILIPLDPAQSAQPNQPRPTARVADDGSFQLSTYLANDGAPAGAYAVIAYWKKYNPKDDEEEGPNLLPPRYLDPKLSGLRVDIKPGKNILDPLRLAP